VTASAWDSTTNIAHYARLATELRDLAAHATSREAREQMIVLATQYEHLAAHAANSRNVLDSSASSEGRILDSIERGSG
jgi:hypothetical protein